MPTYLPYVYCLHILATTCILFYIIYAYHKVTKDLINRILARNYLEYQQLEIYKQQVETTNSPSSSKETDVRSKYVKKI